MKKALRQSRLATNAGEPDQRRHDEDEPYVVVLDGAHLMAHDAFEFLSIHHAQQSGGGRDGRTRFGLTPVAKAFGDGSSIT